MIDIRQQEADTVSALDTRIAMYRTVMERRNRLVGVESDPRFADFIAEVQRMRDRSMEALLDAGDDRTAAVNQGMCRALDSVLDLLKDAKAQVSALAKDLAAAEDFRRRAVNPDGRVNIQSIGDLK